MWIDEDKKDMDRWMQIISKEASIQLLFHKKTITKYQLVIDCILFEIWF